MTRPAIAAVFHIFFGMAVDAPGHLHGCNACDPPHGFHRPVTFLALEAGLDVPLVREVHEVRHIVHRDPGNGFAVLPVFGKLQNLRFFADTRNGFVAADALAHARDTGDRRRGCIDVTVLARDLIVRRMHYVAEFAGLPRPAIREIFAVHPRARHKTDHRDQH